MSRVRCWHYMSLERGLVYWKQLNPELCDDFFLRNLCVTIHFISLSLLTIIEQAELLEVIKVRQVIVYPGEDGYWVAECPSLPGCISQGKTKAEAIASIKEAVNGYIAALEEDGFFR